MPVIRQPRLSSMQVLHRQRILTVQLCKLALQVSNHERVDILGRLGRDEAASASQSRVHEARVCRVRLIKEFRQGVWSRN